MLNIEHPNHPLHHLVHRPGGLYPDSSFASAHTHTVLTNDRRPTKPVWLNLFHGRNDPDEDMDDWGYDGPSIGPLQYVHTTYNCRMAATFHHSADPAEIIRNYGFLLRQSDRDILLRGLNPRDVCLVFGFHEDLIVLEDNDGRRFYFGDYSITT